MCYETTWVLAVMVCFAFTAISIIALNQACLPSIQMACPMVYEYYVSMFFARLVGLGVWYLACFMWRSMQGQLLFFLFMCFMMSDTACTGFVLRSKECMHAQTMRDTSALVAVHGCMEMGWDALVVLFATGLMQEEERSLSSVEDEFFEAPLQQTRYFSDEILNSHLTPSGP